MTDERLAEIREHHRSAVYAYGMDLPPYSQDRADLLAEHDQLRADVAELVTALRLTHEYIGASLLPPVAGWAWYDALSKRCPEYIASIGGMAPHAEAVGE
jgi:hypothetical protein